MEQLLARGSQISELAYLRILQLVHHQTSALVDDLKGYELPNITSRSLLDVTEFNRTLAGGGSASGAGAAATATTISAMLETAMDELFVQQTEGQRYLERESASLGELYSRLLTNYTRYHVSSFSLRVIYVADLPLHTTGSKPKGKSIHVRSSSQPTQRRSSHNIYYGCNLNLCTGSRGHHAIWGYRRCERSG